MDKRKAKKAVNGAVGENIVREEIASMLDAMIHNDFEKAADHCHNCTVLITRRMTLGEAEEVDGKDEDEDEDEDKDGDKDKESSGNEDEDEDDDEENEESSDDDEDEDEDDDKSSDKDEEDKDVKEGWKGPTTKVGTLKFGKKMNKQGPSKAGRPKKVGVKK